MRRQNIFIIAVVLILIVSAGLYIVSSSSGQSESMVDDFPVVEQNTTADIALQNDQIINDDQIMPGQDNQAQGQYIVYEPGVLQANSSRRVVLFFYANWCPTCRPADASFSNNTDMIPQDVVVVRVNYDDPDTEQEEKDLADKYGVTYQHTFVQIDSAGNEVAKWNGGQIDELLGNII